MAIKRKSRAIRPTRKRSAPIVYTIGHSSRSFQELLDLLRTHGVAQLIDVRTIPRSRHNPQFNREVFGKALRNRRIGYRHMKALGGLRRANSHSINTGWRNASFRGYADYMQTPAFETALTQLIEYAERKPTAIMCAEAVPWRCHRSLIADALIVRGFEARDIIQGAVAKLHRLNPMARVKHQKIVYPG